MQSAASHLPARAFGLLRLQRAEFQKQAAVLPAHVYGLLRLQRTEFQKQAAELAHRGSQEQRTEFQKQAAELAHRRPQEQRHTDAHRTHKEVVLGYHGPMELHWLPAHALALLSLQPTVFQKQAAVLGHRGPQEQRHSDALHARMEVALGYP